jgi:hypothetical protein
LVSMISASIVDMIGGFCAQVENAGSNIGEKNCIALDGSLTDALAQDLKVTVMWRNVCKRHLRKSLSVVALLLTITEESR